MKSFIAKSLLLALIATIALPYSSVQAQDKGTGLVAVLDVAKVFKEHAGFKSQMETIKLEADTLKGQIQKQQEAIQLEAQQLGQYEVGSPERNQLEASLEQKQAALRTKARQAETDLLNREAHIYYTTYNQLQTVVGELAEQHGISLVLRFDSNPIDSTNRPEVIKGVNRPVVFHRRLDLTTMVIAQMSSGSANAGSGTVNH